MMITIEDFGTLFETRDEGQVPHVSIGIHDFRELCKLIAALGGTGIVSSAGSSQNGGALTISFSERCVCDIDVLRQAYDDVLSYGDISL
jgi:hypothetical protein